MSVGKHVLDDLLALSMQLNRQAFASPPVEGWLNSFLSLICERFAPLSIQGIQAAQVIGTIAVQMARAGTLPAHAAEQYALDEGSPITMALRTRQLTASPDARIVPITIGEDAIGVLIGYTNQPSDIADEVLATVAAQLGPAIMQHLKTPGPQTGRLTRQIDMMRSLYEATKTVSSALESLEVLNRGARSLVETLHIDHVSVTVADQAVGVGSVVAEYPDNGHVGTKLQLHGYPVYEQLQREYAPIIIKNMDSDPRLGPNREVLQKLGIKKLVTLPMQVQNELIGFVTIDAYYENRDLTPEEIEGAMAITSQLAISIRNAQMFDEMKHRASQLERIADLNRRVTSTFDRLEIFQIVKEDTQTLIDAHQISVALKPSDETKLVLFVLGEKDPSITEFDAEQTALRFVCNSMEPLVIDDISGSEYPDYKLLAQAGMRAVVVVPLVVGGRAIGTYNVANREPGVYSSIDLAMLEQVGNQLAIALENARLFTQAAQRVEIEQLMNRLSGGLQGRGDLHGMLLGTVQEIASALGAKRARVRLQMPPAKPALNAAKLLSLSNKLVDKLSEKREG
jgi:GAF domain-containing protein